MTEQCCIIKGLKKPQTDAILLHSRVLRQYTNISLKHHSSDQALPGPERLLSWLCYKLFLEMAPHQLSGPSNTSPLL